MYSFFRERSTGAIISYTALIARYPYTSFPIHPWPQSTLDWIGVDPVEEIGPPATKTIEKPIKDGYKQNSDGVWQTQWKIVSRFDSKEEEEKYYGELYKQEWENIRSDRNQFLLETDFIFLPDTPISPECKTEFIEYRKKLRDITTGLVDPFDIIWPEKPIYRKS